MKKRFLGTVVVSLFLFNLFNIQSVNLVYADSTIGKKINIISPKIDYIKDKSNIKDFYSEKENVIENEIIVKYRKKSGVFNYIFGLNNNKENVEKIKVESKNELQQRIEELQNDSNVEYFQPNYKYTKLDLAETSQNNSVNSMVLSNGVNENQWYIENLGIPSAWTQSTGYGVKVAVIDTGIDTNHEDLQGKVVGGQDFTSSGSYKDNNGHGTAMAGIIAADRVNGIGVSGIAYDAKLLSVKVLDNLGQGDTLTISKGIKWAADNGAKVLNLSLGGDSNDAVLKDAVNYAVSKGCVIIAASGNDGVQGVMYPAAYDNVIAVGATNEANQWSSFSNYGKEIDVVAPGVNIYSSVPEYVSYEKYKSYPGTSPATAVVSGQVSLILSKQPQLTVSDILNKVQNSSFRLSKTYPDIFYGQGILDVNKAISGIAGQLKPMFTNIPDDNTASTARIITGSTSFSDSLINTADANWYKLSVPTNTVVRLKFSGEAPNLVGFIFRNNFDYLENIIVPEAEYPISEEYYIINKFSTADYYVEISDVNMAKNSWNISIEYMSINDPSIPTVQDLKYNIDTLKQGQVVTGSTLNVGGWALSKNLIGKVEVKVDGQLKQIYNGISRPDVFNVFPKYHDMYSGFNGTVDLSQLAYGNHTLTMVFTDMRGAVIFTNPITFTIADTLKYSIDTVKSGMQVTSNYLPVGGWALSKAGIAKVEAVIDNDVPVQIKYGVSRPDVYSVFRDYNNSTSGFGGNLDIRKYGYGIHSLHLKITYVGGRTVLSAPVNFSIVSTLKISLDNVRQGDVITGTSLGIGGWVLSKIGVAKVEAVIDNSTPVAINYGGARADVYKAFSDYNNNNSGFNGVIDVSKLSYGEHYLELRITEVSSRVTVTSPVRFIVQNSIYSIDTPRNNTTITGNTLNIGGWAISKAGIQKIEAVVDGITYNQLQYGISRPDVYNVFKEYNNQSSGFNGTVDISKLSYGTHKIQIKITDKIGRVSNSNLVSVNITDTKIYAIDSPQNGKVITGGILYVSGWGLSKTGIVKVEALVDGVAHNIQYGASRPDVYNVFKDFNNKSSGLVGKIDVSNLSVGKHSLVVRFTDARGYVLLTEIRTFNI